MKRLFSGGIGSRETMLLTVFGVVVYLCAYQMTLDFSGPGAVPAPTPRGEYRVSGDAGQGIFWTWKWFEQTGFVDGDVTVAVAELLRPWGLWGVYRGMTLLTDPITMSRLLPLPLLLLGLFTLFRWLRDELDVPSAVLGTVLICTYGPFLGSLLGGHGRAFTPVLMFGLLFLLARGRYGAAAATVFLGALLYPPVFLINGGIYGIFWVTERAGAMLDDEGSREWWRELLTAPPARWLAIAVVAGGVLAGAKSHQIAGSPIAGPMYSKAQMTSMAALGPEGRVDIRATGVASPPGRRLWSMIGVPGLSDTPIPSALEPTIEPAKEIAVNLLRGLLICGWLLFIIVRRPWSSFDRLLYAMVGSSVLLFFAARALFPTLYLPNRFLYPLLFVPSLVIVRLVHTAGPRWPRVGAWTMVGALPALLYVAPLKAKTGDYREYAPVYEALGRIDGPAMVAAPPRVCDQIPTFARKSCLVSNEISGHAVFFRDYWPRIRERTSALFNAYFASDRATIVSFAEEYSVDYIVVDHSVFEQIDDYTYFQPFTEQLEELIGTRSRKEFALIRLSGEPVQRIDDRFSLVATDALSPSVGPSSSPAGVSGGDSRK